MRATAVLHSGATPFGTTSMISSVKPSCDTSSDFVNSETVATVAAFVFTALNIVFAYSLTSGFE